MKSPRLHRRLVELINEFSEVTIYGINKWDDLHLCVIGNTCTNPSTWTARAGALGGLWVRGQSWIQAKFHATLGYTIWLHFFKSQLHFSIKISPSCSHISSFSTIPLLQSLPYPALLPSPSPLPFTPTAMLPSFARRCCLLSISRLIYFFLWVQNCNTRLLSGVDGERSYFNFSFQKSI